MTRYLVNSLICFSLILLSFALKAQTIENEYIISTEKEINEDSITIYLKDVVSNTQHITIDFIGTSDYPLYLITVEEGVSNDYIYNALQSMSSIRHIQNNYILHARYSNPNDSLLGYQWHLTNEDYGLNMASGWMYETGGNNLQNKKPVIALLDDGYMLDHTDAASFWVNPDEIPYNNIDDDNNGFVDDIHGWNFEYGSNNFNQTVHGTAVMGLAAANTNNGSGIASPNWDAEILPLQTDFSSSNVYQAYAYLYELRKLFNESSGDHGAFISVINNSFGADGMFPSDLPIWCEFFDELGSVGIISTIAVTNMNVDVDVYGDLPTLCSSEFMVAVGGINQDGELQSGFSYENVDIVAGATNVLSLGVDEPYSYCTGTSFASPQIASLLSVFYSAHCSYISTEMFNSPSTVAMELVQRLYDHISPIQGLSNLIKYSGIPNSAGSLGDFDTFCSGCHPSHNINYWMEENTLVVNWDNSEENEGTIFYWRDASSQNNPWNSIDAGVGTSLTVAALPNCYDIEFYFSSVCSSEPYTSQYFEFNTGNCCTAGAPSIVNQNNPTEFIIDIASFNLNNTYVLQYRPVMEGALWESISEIGPSNIINNIRPCTEYEFKLISICPISGNIDLIEFNEFSQGCELCQSDYDYCEAAGNNTYEHIKEVRINGIENSSSDDENGYGLYNTFSSFPLEKGQQNTIDIVPDSYILNTIHAIYSVWIDYNQNGDFEEEEELFAIHEQNMEGISSDFVIPESALSGYTRMRIKLTWLEYDGQESYPCQESFYGEIEDYCIYIEASDSDDCPPISDAIINYNNSTHNFEVEAICANPDLELLAIYHKRPIDATWNLQFSNSLQFSLAGYAEDDGIELQFQSYCFQLPGQHSDIYVYSNMTSTSTEENASSMLNIYPNPFDDYIYIEGLTLESDQRINILTQDAMPLNNFRISQGSNTNSVRLDIRDIPSGVYILEVISPEGIFTEKIIKM